MRAIVVGAGVIGLSCGVRLAEAGHEVDVIARDLAPETTSSVAAAVWYPYLASPHERVAGWAATSYAEFARLAASTPASGVRMAWGTELLRAPAPDPWWAGAVPRLDRATRLPAGYAAGRRFESPIVDMRVYLPWLAGRLTEVGGRITRMALPSLPNRAPLVVNCCGIAARSLAADPSVTPVRGQVVLVSQPGLREWLIDDSDAERPTYVVPRTADVVLGGTSQSGDWNRRPDPRTAEEILDRARRLVPELRESEVLGHRVGLRPARPSVRLETERTASGAPVVHCYGHGGAGVTTSWGCAEDVVREVAALCT